MGLLMPHWVALVGWSDLTLVTFSLVLTLPNFPPDASFSYRSGEIKRLLSLAVAQLVVTATKVSFSIGREGSQLWGAGS